VALRVGGRRGCRPRGSSRLRARCGSDRRSSLRNHRAPATRVYPRAIFSSALVREGVTIGTYI
jgi:hypothetical protein